MRRYGRASTEPALCAKPASRYRDTLLDPSIAPGVGTTVAGGAFIKLAATLQTVGGLPLSGLGLLFGVDRLMATCTALTNVVGNVVAVFVIAVSERGFDRAKFDTYLAEQAAGRIRPSGAEVLQVGD